MPFPNFHAARVHDPSDFVSIVVLKTLPNGVMIYGGKLKGGEGGSTAQTYRFPRSKFTPAEAHQWLKDHNVKSMGFEEATGKQDGSDIISELRYDYLPRRLTKVNRTDDGFLRGTAAVAKVGVLAYRLNDGTVRKELVPAETLFAQDSMDSLKLKPITDEHPPEKMLTSSSVKLRHVGTTGENITREDDFLVSSLVVMDSGAIVNAEKGRQQLSPGYRCELRMDEGEFKGEHYDAIQVKRTYNHLALVDNARGGSDLKLHLDGVDDTVNLDGFESDIRTDNKDNSPEDIFYNPNSQRSPRMKKVVIDGIEYDAAPEVANRLDKAEKDAADAKVALATEKAAHDVTKADRDTVKTKLDAAEKRDIPAEAKKLADARVKLVGQVTPHLDKEQTEKLDTMSDAELKQAVILKAFPSAKDQLAGASEAYVAARFDSALDVLKTGDSSALADQRRAANPDPTRKDSVDLADQDAARKRMTEDITGAYKGEVKK